MQTLLAIFLFSVLLSTGTSLECEVCHSSGTSCTGIRETCGNGQDMCTIILTESSLGGMVIQNVAKTCGYSEACKSSPTYMTFDHGQYVRSMMACCVGDACSTATPQIPPGVTKPNGKQCPGCYSLSPLGCEKETTVNCAGPEEFCLDMAEQVTYGKFVISTTMKGCVTKPVCDAKEGEFTAGGVQTHITKAECKPASAAA